MIAGSVIALGQALGIPVLAEGVEDESQAYALRVRDCEQAQGSLFARPIPPAEREAFVMASPV